MLTPVIQSLKNIFKNNCIFLVLCLVLSNIITTFDTSNRDKQTVCKYKNKMKTLETLTKASQIKSEENQNVYVADCNAQVWFDGTYFCARKDGINIIRRKTFNAIWNYLYAR